MSRRRNPPPPVPAFDDVLAQPLPSVDLADKSLAVTISTFGGALDRIIALGREDVIKRRAEHASRGARDKEKAHKIEEEIETCGRREEKEGIAMQKELDERKQTEADVAGAQRRLKTIRDKAVAAESEIEGLRSRIAVLTKEHSKEKSVLDSQAASLAPELHVVERKLGWSVEGVGKDMLMFKFTNLDERDLSQEFSLTIDLSERTYRVPSTSPHLPTLPILLEQLNETREFYGFIRDVRKAFLEVVEGGRWSVEGGNER